MPKYETFSLTSEYIVRHIFALQEKGEQCMKILVEIKTILSSFIGICRTAKVLLLDKDEECFVAALKPGTQPIIMPKKNTSTNTLVAHIFHCNYSGVTEDKPEYF